MRLIHLELKGSLSEQEVNSLLLERANSDNLGPELVLPEEVKEPRVYKRFQNLEEKAHFRQNLIEQLTAAWRACFEEEKANQLIDKFRALLESVDEDGALIFGDLINREQFQSLVNEYDQILESDGSKSWIHSYVNLGNHPSFLSDQNFNDAFLHPLLIALIAYRVGGPIRIVDARGKNAEPISILAQDNMLHIDNTPFNDEYKVILTWEKGKASGPKGQNFVFVPGTHKGARDCFVNDSGEVYSTENASIFIRDHSIEQVFSLQNKVSGVLPTVVEAQHPDMPLTTVFAAGSLVHHRYRTATGFSRSCAILAFHRVQDNPGQFMSSEHVNQLLEQHDLNHFLFGNASVPKSQGKNFIAALLAHAEKIGKKIEEMSQTHGTEIVEQQHRVLTKEELVSWKSAATKAPSIERMKIQKGYFPLGRQLELEEFRSLLTEMMMTDKHGPLDLILYSDNHEEIRKWARNRIREMKMTRLNARLDVWFSQVTQPQKTDLLSPEAIVSIATQLLAAIDERDSYEDGRLDESETISSPDAYRSIRQLIADLAEAVVRCDCRQTFLSTCLFLFWACDELICLNGDESDASLEALGKELLSNYISTAILIEKQIKSELEQEKTVTSAPYAYTVFGGTERRMPQDAVRQLDDEDVHQAMLST